MFKADLRSFLQDEFNSRRQRNPAYSLRAFARHLQMDASSLSKIITGKRKASRNNLDQICKALKLTSEAHQRFQQSLDNEKCQKQLQVESFNPIDPESSHLVGHWYHFAILELLRCRKDFFHSEEIARHLKISVQDSDQALEDLLKLELIQSSTPSRPFQLRHSQNILLDRGFTTHSLREMQKQILGKAQEAMDLIPFEKRVQTALTISVDENLIPEVKAKIKGFLRKLNKYIELNSQNRDQVYVVNISCFPVSEPLNSTSRRTTKCH